MTFNYCTYFPSKLTINADYVGQQNFNMSTVQCYLNTTAAVLAVGLAFWLIGPSSVMEPASVDQRLGILMIASCSPEYEINQNEVRTTCWQMNSDTRENRRHVNGLVFWHNIVSLCNERLTTAKFRTIRWWYTMDGTPRSLNC